LKSIFLFIIPLFFIARSVAQDTVEQKKRLTDSVIERFYVLKSDRETKQGPYKALFLGKTVIAAGNFTKGKKTGTWNFYNTRGVLVQTFNYDNNKLSYIGPFEAGGDVGFLFDEKMKKNDTATRPIKIGGDYYGYIPYVSLFHLPFETFGVAINRFNAYIELVISPLGRLADYKVHLTSKYYDYDHSFNMDINLFSEEDRLFYAATLNNRPIVSRIIIKCFIKWNGELDFY
jgi:hypothetical protein